jgi:sugar lactone lactonase YvrE
VAITGHTAVTIEAMRFLLIICALGAACTAVTPMPTATIPQSPPPASQRTAPPSPSPTAQRFRIDAVAGTLERRPGSLTEGDGGPATSAHLAQLTALAVGNDGDVYLAEALFGARPGQVQTAVRRVDHTTGLITTLAGPQSLGYVNALGFTLDGDLLIGGNYSAAALWRLRAGRLEPIAGTSKGGERGDGGPALAAAIFNVNGLGYDRDGNLHIADWNDGGRIRRIKPDGTIESYGTAPPVPFGFALDIAGNAYIGSNSVAGTYVYRIAPDGAGTIIAGSAGRFGFGGDGGQALAARFSSITALALGPDGSLYLADTGNHRIRRIDPSGIVTTIAGTGRSGYTGDGGPALDADLDEVRWLATGPGGALYLGSYSPSTVRKLTPLP